MIFQSASVTKSLNFIEILINFFISKVKPVKIASDALRVDFKGFIAIKNCFGVALLKTKDSCTCQISLEILGIVRERNIKVSNAFGMLQIYSGKSTVEVSLFKFQRISLFTLKILNYVCLNLLQHMRVPFL